MPSAPPNPAPYSTAPGGQVLPGYLQAAQQTSQSNRPTQITPWGTNTWNGNVNTSTLSGPGAGLFSAAEGLVPTATSQLTGSLDTSQLSPWGLSPTQSATQAQGAAANAEYGLEKGWLDPQWNQTDLSTKNALIGMGATPGDATFDTGYGLEQNSKNQAYSAAQNQALIAGQGELGALGSYGSQVNQQRAQQIQQQLQQQGWGLNEINQLLSSIPGGPQASGLQSGVNATQALNDWYAANLGNAQAVNSFWGNIAGGVGSAAGGIGKGVGAAAAAG